MAQIMSKGEKMTTRCLICIKRDTDKYETIYCHNDGYLSYVGAMLFDYYNSKEKAEELIKLGNITALNKFINPNPECKHNYYDRQPNVVVAYGRDCGRFNENSVMCSLQDLKDWAFVEYIYIFDNDTWLYLSSPFDKTDTLENGLNKEYKILGFNRPKDTYRFYTGLDIEKYKNKQKGND